MTIAELIEQLQAFPSDLEVLRGGLQSMLTIEIVNAAQAEWVAPGLYVEKPGANLVVVLE